MIRRILDNGRVCWIVLFLAMLAAISSSSVLGAEQAEDPRRLHTTFLPMASPEAPDQLAVQWTGSPTARLTAWVDLDGDGAWSESEQILHEELLDREILVLDLDRSLDQRLTPERPVRFRVLEEGGESWETTARVGGVGHHAQGISPLGLGGCGWETGFGLAGLTNDVRAAAVFDDGTGPALYVGGLFTAADDVATSFIARWDGTAWSGVGGGMDDWVLALEVYDDGTGEALYAGGGFRNAGGEIVGRIAKWDGTAWTDVGGGLSSRVWALEVYDDGGGEALYAAGQFTLAGLGVVASRIAKWDGTSWSALGSGLDDTVEALTVYDDGNGAALYAGGHFLNAGGTGANKIAKWDGTSWSALGSGLEDDLPPVVYALETFDDGGGTELYAAGIFGTAGGIDAENIARWDGTSWSPLGTGVNGQATALVVHDDGSGAELYIGGDFLTAGGLTSSGLAKWDGTAWSVAGFNTINVDTLAVYDDGGGAELYAGGGFRSAGGTLANRIARWQGAQWTAVTANTDGNGLNGSASAMAAYGEAGSETLYVGGNFTTAGQVDTTGGLAGWDGMGWEDSLLFGGVDALTVYDDGSGPALYAGGLTRLSQWDGMFWTTPGIDINGSVRALVVYDDGNGAALYAAGTFTTVSGVSAQRIARWDGTAWTALGDGLNNSVNALAVYDDGGGLDLYAGGTFTMAGGVSAAYIARWDGTEWSALGSGMDQRVTSLATHDAGTGTTLFAGGAFTTAGGVSASRIAQWDGAAWTALGSGMDDSVDALLSHNDGTGSLLYAGGSFSTAGGRTANAIARWDGTAWTGLGNGVNPQDVRALASYDDGNGNALYLTGAFGAAGDFASSSIAKYSCPPDLLFADGFESGSESRWSQSTGMALRKGVE